MNMKHGLTAVLVAVEHASEPFFDDPLSLSYLVSSENHLTHERGVSILEINDSFDVSSGYEQYVYGSLWVDVSEREELIIGIDLL